MSSQTITMTEDIRQYLLNTTVGECDVLGALRRETEKLPDARMQISPEQGQLLTLLARLCGARRALEIGTFTGYSAICIARGLPEGGELVACDVSKGWTDIARRFWEQAGVADRIVLQLAPALQTLATLEGPLDFVFIDADKENYGAYYDRALELVRSGGLIAVDNALWSGRILDAENNDPETKAIRTLNARIASDDRVDCSLLPIGDGLMLARKK